MHILQRQPLHQRLRQSDNRPRRIASRRGYILNQNVVELRRQPPHRLGRHLARGRRVRIVLRNQDRRLHILHRDVLEREVRDIVAPVARRLDADPLVRPFEVDALGMDVLHATRDLTADRQPMSILKRAIRDRDVRARRIRPRRVDRARLDRHIVVARARKNVVNHNIARAEWIDRIRIRRLRCQNAQVAQHHIVRIIRNNLPHARVLHGHAFHPHMLGMIEHHAKRPRMIVAQHARILRANDVVPPHLAVAVDGALALNRHVFRMDRAHQRLHRRIPREHRLRIIRAVG